jgi:hypothetical protein
MPEEHYLLEPNPEIRNFGELFGHVANAQFRACAAAKGEANPNQGKDQELLNKSKAEFVAVLAAAFAYCDPVYVALTDQSAVELVEQGNNMVARGYLLANNVAHSNEMYGTSAVYMRLENLVPPSTERRTRSRARQYLPSLRFPLGRRALGVSRHISLRVGRERRASARDLLWRCS